MSQINLNLNLRVTRSCKFNQVDDYRLFIFEPHKKLVEDFNYYINIKLPNNCYASFKYLISPINYDNTSEICSIDESDFNKESIVYLLH